MRLVNIADGSPTNFLLFAAGHPSISFPTDLTTMDLSLYGIQKVDTPEPSYDPTTQVLNENGYIQDAFGKWQINWVVTAIPPKTQQQLDEEAAHADLAASLSSAKLDPVVQYLVNHTPAECAAYVQTNVTNLATANTVMQKMAIALCVLAKQNIGK